MKYKAWVYVVAGALLIALLLYAPSVLPPYAPAQPEPRGGWRGMLSVAVVPTFRTGGSLTQYASSTAKGYTKETGVLVDVREMSAYALRDALARGTAPDVVLFGSGALASGEGLLPLDGDLTRVREEALQAARWEEKMVALPVAMGGYVLLAHGKEYTAAGAADAQTPAQWLAAVSSAKGIHHAMPGAGFPMAALVAAASGTTADPETALYKDAGAVRHSFSWPEFALEKKAVVYVGTSYEVSRMRVLEAGGRVEGWEAVSWNVLAENEREEGWEDGQEEVAKGWAYTDMVLFAGATRPECAGRAGAADNAQRNAAAGRLLAAFHGDAARQALAATGLVPVTDGEPLYQGVKGYGQIEEGLRRPLLIPNAFSQEERLAAAGWTAADALRFLLALRGQDSSFQDSIYIEDPLFDEALSPIS